MARRDHGGDTSGVKQRVRQNGLGKLGHGLGIELTRANRLHLRCVRTRIDPCHFAEPGAGDVVESGGKLESGEPIEGSGKLINCVLFGGKGAVAAGIGDFDLERTVSLFRGLHAEIERSTLAADGRAGSIAVDTESGIDQVAMIANQPLDAIIWASLFIRGQGQNEVPRGAKAFFFEAKEIGYKDGVVVLHILCAASVEIAILFAKYKWIEGPVGAQRFDDIKMADKKNRPLGARAAQPDDEVRFARNGTENVDVGFREAGSAETCRKCLGGRRGSAGGDRCVDFDQLAKNLTRAWILPKRGVRHPKDKCDPPH